MPRENALLAAIGQQPSIAPTTYDAPPYEDPIGIRLGQRVLENALYRGRYDPTPSEWINRDDPNFTPSIYAGDREEMALSELPMPQQARYEKAFAPFIAKLAKRNPDAAQEALIRVWQHLKNKPEVADNYIRMSAKSAFNDSLAKQGLIELPRSRANAPGQIRYPGARAQAVGLRESTGEAPGLYENALAQEAAPSLRPARTPPSRLPSHTFHGGERYKIESKPSETVEDFVVWIMGENQFEPWVPYTSGEFFESNKILGKMGVRELQANLTDDEMRVLDGYLAGKTKAQIGQGIKSKFKAYQSKKTIHRRNAEKRVDRVLPSLAEKIKYYVPVFGGAVAGNALMQE